MQFGDRIEIQSVMHHTCETATNIKQLNKYVNLIYETFSYSKYLLPQFLVPCNLSQWKACESYVLSTGELLQMKHTGYYFIQREYILMTIYKVYNYFSKSKRCLQLVWQRSNAYIIKGFLSTKLTGMLKKVTFHIQSLNIRI